MRSLLADTFPKTLLTGLVTFTLALAANSGESKAEVAESSTAASAPAEFTISGRLTLPPDNILASIDTAPDRAATTDAPASSAGAGSGSLKRFGVICHAIALRAICCHVECTSEGLCRPQQASRCHIG